MNFSHLQASLEQLLSAVTPSTGRILDCALSGADLTIEEATELFDSDGSDLLALIAAADHLRARTAGDVVTYVVNRNIN
ncbi:MAG TPA: 7,8-didemethyl-8-hydroxy-5-deazariboflavin synthase subunit CofH, partial [Candidatus Binatia bacterium]|nr:7,8-didemethyl-8-hydroxy-5-deazariboflavin synthase subunit CofH [Candidatus Binatia bacterium]